MGKKLDQGLCRVEEFILAFGVISASVVLFANVVMNNVLNSGLSWAEEYARYAIIWVTFAGCGVAVRKKVHMQITALHEIMNPRLRLTVEIIINLVGVFFTVFLGYVGWRLTFKTLVNGQISTAMPVPMWIIYAAVPFGSALTLIRLFQQLSGQFRRLSGKEGDAE